MKITTMPNLSGNTPALETRNLTIRFGGHVAVDNVSCAFQPGSLSAIVGANGAGKTTYFNLISGQLAPSSGDILLDGIDITNLSVSSKTKRGIGRSFQLTNLFPNLSVLENVRLTIQSHRNSGFNLRSLTDDLQDLKTEAEQVVAKVNLMDYAHLPVTALSHGNQRKLEVAMLIALRPPIMLFDEPTAGMSVDEVPAVLELIEGLKSDSNNTILLVEHKMAVIRYLADRIIVLHNGKLIADGSPDAVISSKEVQSSYLGQDDLSLNADG